MERKILNSQLSRKTCVHLDKTEQKRKVAACSVHPLSNASNDENSSGDIRETRHKCSYLSLASQRTKATQEAKQMTEDDPETEDDFNKNTVCSGCGQPEKMKLSYSSSTSTPRFIEVNPADTLQAELRRCKKELDGTNNATKKLEQKYMKINVELGEMQQRHDRFLAERSIEKNSESNECSGIGSDLSIKRKYTQIFQHGNSIVLLSGSKKEPQKLEPNTDSRKHAAQHRHTKQNFLSTCANSQQASTDECNYSGRQPQMKSKVKNKGRFNSRIKSRPSKDNVSFFETPKNTSSEQLHTRNFSNSSNLNRVYEKIQEAISTERKDGLEPLKGLLCDDVKELQKTIAELHREQAHLCNVIRQQQTYLQDFHGRYVKAKHIMETQRYEIEKLTHTNKDLQDEADKGMSKLRQQLEAKINEMARLSQRLHDARIRSEKVVKENHALNERVRSLQAQAKDLKVKLEDLTKRKAALIGKLKNAERDLRVFKNYNKQLKCEKQRQTEEIQKIRERLENQQATSKRVLAHQRDLSDKNCRDLQRRIYELEHKLGRSNNSTSGLLQERDRLISELQAQVNTLVHNFEISQKHIRVLRRQIINAAGLSNSIVGSAPPRKNM